METLIATPKAKAGFNPVGDTLGTVKDMKNAILSNKTRALLQIKEALKAVKSGEFNF